MLFPSAETAMHFPDTAIYEEQTMTTNNRTRPRLPLIRCETAAEKKRLTERLFQWARGRRPGFNRNCTSQAFDKHLSSRSKHTMRGKEIS